MIRVIRSSADRTKSLAILSGVGTNEILLDCFDGTLYESSLRMTSRFQSYCIRGALIKAKPIGATPRFCDSRASDRLGVRRLVAAFKALTSQRTPKVHAKLKIVVDVQFVCLEA